MTMRLPASLRGYLNEPAVPDPPVRVRRDWVLVVTVSLVAVLEAVFRTDEPWTGLPLGWQLAALVVFALSTPPALLARRTRPLLATVWGFAPVMAFGALMALWRDDFGGLSATAAVLIVVYALYRWGSGRDGAIGLGILVAAGIVGNLTDPGSTLGEWIGGFVVLSIPVEAGLIVRYRSAARGRLIDDAKAREREQLARELHDTVAHHVSAIAVQAQAGRALAATDPERALGVLAVIEDAASRTLTEMRAMVGSLRSGDGAELAPQRGVDDLDRLVRTLPGPLDVSVEIADDLGPISPAVDVAIYRIAQESITNSVRHARRATSVLVCLEPAGSSVLLTVTDDGEGSDPSSGQGYGLLGMAERAHLLGGTFHAGPLSPRGWRVRAELPRSTVPV